MHNTYMKRALDIAVRGRYTCRPNPMVGAVLVEDDQIIAEAWHQQYGEAHAEVLIFDQFPEDRDFSRCVLYVTLEPCAHHGKTPPCVELVIRKKIKKVVIGSSDPNPLVAGKGIARLKEAGIEVLCDILHQECLALNEIFFKYITTKKPFVLLKSAMTLDGRIAADSGHAQWVSCELSRQHAQSLRAFYAAIMVGIGTVLADDPHLTCRLDGMPQPLRVIADSHLRIPLQAHILQNLDTNPSLIACLKNANPDKASDLKKQGVHVIECPEKDGRLDLSFLLSVLGEMEIDSLLVEGGGVLHGAFLKEKAVDKLAFYIAPKILASGIPAISGETSTHMDDAQKFSFHTFQNVGDDIYVEAYAEDSCLQGS